MMRKQLPAAMPMKQTQVSIFWYRKRNQREDRSTTLLQHNFTELTISESWRTQSSVESSWSHSDAITRMGIASSVTLLMSIEHDPLRSRLPSLEMVTSSSRKEGAFLHASACCSIVAVSSVPSVLADGTMHMFLHLSLHFGVVRGMHIKS